MLIIIFRFSLPLAQCVNGHPYRNNCPSTLLFDDILKYCTFEKEARCGPFVTSEYKIINLNFDNLQLYYTFCCSHIYKISSKLSSSAPIFYSVGCLCFIGRTEILAFVMEYVLQKGRYILYPCSAGCAHHAGFIIIIIYFFRLGVRRLGSTHWGTTRANGPPGLRESMYIA